MQLVPFCDVDVRFILPHSLLQTRENVADITQIGISGATLNSTKTVLVVSDLENKTKGGTTIGDISSGCPIEKLSTNRLRQRYKPNNSDIRYQRYQG
ncbi:MAG TPA: hypothetical protein V6D35_07485 [Candidatus Sericytochromatia bacterium]